MSEISQLRKEVALLRNELAQTRRSFLKMALTGGLGVMAASLLGRGIPSVLAEPEYDPSLGIAHLGGGGQGVDLFTEMSQNGNPGPAIGSEKVVMRSIMPGWQTVLRVEPNNFNSQYCKNGIAAALEVWPVHTCDFPQYDNFGRPALLPDPGLDGSQQHYAFWYCHIRTNPDGTLLDMPIVQDYFNQYPIPQRIGFRRAEDGKFTTFDMTLDSSGNMQIEGNGATLKGFNIE